MRKIITAVKKTLFIFLSPQNASDKTWEFDIEVRFVWIFGLAMISTKDLKLNQTIKYIKTIFIFGNTTYRNR